MTPLAGAPLLLAGNALQPDLLPDLPLLAGPARWR